MTLRSVIKRLLSGPTVHKLVCCVVTEDSLNCSTVYQEEITIEELHPGICDKVLAIRESNVKYAFEGMARQSTVVLARWKGSIAGHAVLKPSGEMENHNRFWKNKDYIHYCYVAPQYRGRKIYPCMLIYLAKKCFERQAGKAVYISADYENTASIRGMQKAGFRYWGTLMEYGWGGIIFFRMLKQEKEEDKVV